MNTKTNNVLKENKKVLKIFNERKKFIIKKLKNIGKMLMVKEKNKKKKKIMKILNKSKKIMTAKPIVNNIVI